MKISRTAQIQLILDAHQQGFLGNPTEDVVLREKLLEELGLIGFDSPVGPDYKRAMMENAMMDEGQVPPVGEYENLEVHHETHLREMKEPRFDDKSPAAQHAYWQHFQATRQKWITQQQRELMARLQQKGQAEPGGQGPGAGPAEPPQPNRASAGAPEEAEPPPVGA